MTRTWAGNAQYLTLAKISIGLGVTNSRAKLELTKYVVELDGKPYNFDYRTLDAVIYAVSSTETAPSPAPKTHKAK